MRITPLLIILLIASPILAQEPKTQKGIPYAEPKNERQMLDVYAPTTGKNLPVVISAQHVQKDGKFEVIPVK